ncbi:c-type cytochrome [Bowmanella yangjiangensis]|uniref:c-type cytochrome n=1 Tax=Bowmanella yangjiangensis TaxID=2811230 RepID=UPI002FCDCBA6
MKYKALLVLSVGLLGVFAGQADDMSRDAIKDRIKPLGQIHVAGAQAQTAAASGPRSGADVFKTSCFACHGTGVMGAPKSGDAAAWGDRIANGMDTMLKHAIEGFNAMPPRGTCGNCSDDEIKAAIEHMIEGL